MPKRIPSAGSESRNATDLFLKAPRPCAEPIQTFARVDDSSMQTGFKRVSWNGSNAFECWVNSAYNDGSAEAGAMPMNDRRLLTRWGVTSAVFLGLSMSSVLVLAGAQTPAQVPAQTPDG